MAAVVARRQLLQKVLRSWHDQIEVQKQKLKLAKLFHMSRLVSSVLSQWRAAITVMQEKRAVKQELHEEVTARLLDRKLARLFMSFQFGIEQSRDERRILSRLGDIRQNVELYQALAGAFESMKKTTDNHQAHALYTLTVKNKVWRALSDYRQKKARQQAVSRDLDELYRQKVKSKALNKLVQYRNHRRVKSTRLNRAQYHFETHSQRKRLRTSFFAVVKYAIYRKQLKSASLHFTSNLVIKVFAAFKVY